MHPYSILELWYTNHVTICKKSGSQIMMRANTIERKLLKLSDVILVHYNLMGRMCFTEAQFIGCLISSAL